MKKTVLLVDDDEMVLGALRQALVQKGYGVAVATDGQRALDWLRVEHADLVVLDAVMPGLSGFDVCRKIREDDRTAEVPVIFLTAKGDVPSRRAAEESGSDLFLTKPVLAARLLNMIGIFLSNDIPLVKRRRLTTP